MLQGFADMYLQGQDAANPKASPLHAPLGGLPPIRIDVGDNEVLLADSLRYADRARAAGVEITLSVWEGMPHVFQSSLGQFLAAEESVNAIGAFLSSRLDAPADATIPSTPHERNLTMTRVLFVGQKPETVDFTDSSLPPGFNAEKIQAGIDIAQTTMTERGWDGDVCMIAPDDSGIAVLTAQLVKTDYDCVVIGGGLRIPPKGLPFFEKVVNAIHQGAPKAAIAFNTRPEDTAEAAARWIGAS